eukprot:CAMPEP_0201488270 /NCGR_PEP_ID=MMETSP0151_2-20130828/17863_1 /ASSEMBLY_ACC=CAM_ASM_000257 /TAXON_ID=200890 /ORGANISM="Paramoeba atlantica, Strain 621/1 / CCAP 1560/9" /LENGTH=191 /DNA_ID=CAMNT_0047873529 /DNA_START=65 /DNA_END=636 /DNA_ORIENTATION=-
MNKSSYKICVLGDGGVGKTALTIQLCSNHFVFEYDPTIEDSYRKQCVIDEKPAFLEILDTAGQEEFTALRDQWIRDSEGFVVMYSVVSRSSFLQVQATTDSIRRVQCDCECPIMLAGNKCDLDSLREVTREEGMAQAQEMGTLFKETSAKTRLNVEDAFYDVIRAIRVQYEKDKKESEMGKKKLMKKKQCS